MKTVLFENHSLVPSKIICIGRNYVEHIAELGNEVPDEMVVFNKPNSAISTTLNSHHQEQLHYEAELCFLVKNIVIRIFFERHFSDSNIVKKYGNPENILH